MDLYLLTLVSLHVMTMMESGILTGTVYNFGALVSESPRGQVVAAGVSREGLGRVDHSQAGGMGKRPCPHPCSKEASHPYRLVFRCLILFLISHGGENLHHLSESFVQ